MLVRFPVPTTSTVHAHSVCHPSDAWLLTSKDIEENSVVPLRLTVAGTPGLGDFVNNINDERPGCMRPARLMQETVVIPVPPVQI